MPLDLSNPEGMFPFHYDKRYEPGTNIFDRPLLNTKDVIQSTAKKIRGCPLNKKELSKVFDLLESKNMLQRGPGDQEVQKSIEEIIKALRTSRKVAAKWLI